MAVPPYLVYFSQKVFSIKIRIKTFQHNSKFHNYRGLKKYFPLK